MTHNNSILRLLPLLLALAIGGIASAQETQWQPFGELTAGITKYKGVTLPTYGAALGLQTDGFTVGLRYRHTDRSPLHEAEPMHEVSLMLQHNIRLSPQLELYGGVATGFAIDHSQKEFGLSKYPTLSGEVDLGVRYYVSENVALTFSVGMGVRMGGNDWRALAKQLPYDPRTIPTYTTATGGVSIGIPPKTKKINLPARFIVEGTAPILTAYGNN